MSIKITRHEIVKDRTGKIVRLIVGFTFTDINGNAEYRDRIFTIGSPESDFQALPTKIEFRAKVEEWIMNVPITQKVQPDGSVIAVQGKSLLQTMKESVQNRETVVSLKAGQAGSLVGETIQEVI